MDMERYLYLEDPTYTIVRHFRHGGNATVAEGLTLQEAKAHCNDPDSSSRTCTTDSGNALTDERGPWFDGYYEE